MYQVYGAHQKLDRLIPYVVKNSLNNKKFDCTNGNQSRDFLHIDDLTDLLIKILNKKKVKKGIFNVGTGNPLQVKKIINLITNITKKGKPLFGKIKMRNVQVLSHYHLSFIPPQHTRLTATTVLPSSLSTTLKK